MQGLPVVPGGPCGVTRAPWTASMFPVVLGIRPHPGEPAFTNEEQLRQGSPLTEITPLVHAGSRSLILLFAAEKPVLLPGTVPLLRQEAR